MGVDAHIENQIRVQKAIYKASVLATVGQLGPTICEVQHFFLVYLTKRE